MAPKKSATEPAKKSNKFRLVVFEGDFIDGSFSEIAQALTSALRPTATPVVRHIQNGKPAAQLLAPGAEEDVQAEEEDADIEAGVEQPDAEAEAAPRMPRVSRPK